MTDRTNAQTAKLLPAHIRARAVITALLHGQAPGNTAYCLGDTGSPSFLNGGDENLDRVNITAPNGQNVEIAIGPAIGKPKTGMVAVFVNNSRKGPGFKTNTQNDLDKLRAYLTEKCGLILTEVTPDYKAACNIYGAARDSYYEAKALTRGPLVFTHTVETAEDARHNA